MPVGGVEERFRVVQVTSEVVPVERGISPRTVLRSGPETTLALGNTSEITRVRSRRYSK
jgi:hypothetical protein